MVDVSNKLQVFESPFKKSIYSRNVWDMQVFNNKIYIGQGDSGINAGPIPITSFDPSTNKFTSEFMIDGEQINAFKILNGKLVVPDHDPKEDWSFGNFYVLEADKWVKYRTIPKFIHTYDMEYSNGRMFAVGETNGTAAGLVVSDDFGKTWRYVGDISLGVVGYVSLFVFKNEVYALSNVAVAQFRAIYPCEYLLKFNGTKFVPVSDAATLLPGMTRNMYQLERFTPFNNQLMYIAVVGGFLRVPKAMYAMSDIGKPVRVTFAETTAVPADILVRGNKIYVLAFIRRSSTLYTNIVYESIDSVTWTETLRFNRDTFARSFEELNGVMYFGLGMDNNDPKAIIPASSGTILRVQYQCPMKPYCVNTGV